MKRAWPRMRVASTQFVKSRSRFVSSTSFLLIKAHLIQNMSKFFINVLYFGTKYLLCIFLKRFPGRQTNPEITKLSETLQNVRLN